MTNLVVLEFLPHDIATVIVGAYPSSLIGNCQGATVPPLEASAAWTARTLRARLAPRYRRLTVSPARTNVALFIHRAVRLAAVLAALTAASDSRCHQVAAASAERWATPL